VNVEELLTGERAAVDTALRRLVPPDDKAPDRLRRGMAHAVFAGGKRVRPILARLAHRAAGGDPNTVTEAACGLELIHTYSLVHDDLPALDNDVLRRGQPTVHVAFDEATAILVGDALLTEGLLFLARYPEGIHYSRHRAEAVEAVAEAISARGMIGGQVEDLEATGQLGGGAADPEQRLDRIHRLKTGCLLRVSVEVGAILAGAADSVRRKFTAYGESLGLAFQVSDDILDATATDETLGKTAGKDLAAGKLTYVTLYGLDSAHERLDELERKSTELAREIEGDDGELGAIARFVCRRRS
jgi:geranylgeranyl pyrophosphate synthase